MYGVYNLMSVNVRFCGPWKNFGNTNNHIITILINKNKLITNEIGFYERGKPTEIDVITKTDLVVVSKSQLNHS